MKTKVDILKEHKNRGDVKAFNNELSNLMPGLKRYVKNRLRMAKAKGKISSGIYSADDIIDEVYMIIHRDIEDVTDEKVLKIKLFKAVNEVLDLLMTKDNNIPEKVDIDTLIAGELKTMEEKITSDADGETVLIEDLDDISYHLDDDKPKVYILDSESEENILNALNVDTNIISGNMDKRKELGKTYGNLPEISRAVLDLYAHGNLTVEEIAEIKSFKTEQVEEIIERIKLKITSAI